MFRPISFEFVRSISLSILLLSACALGQFEVAPDHFDSSSPNATVRHVAHKGHAKRGSATAARVAVAANGQTSQAVAQNRRTTRTTAHTPASPRPNHPRTTAALGPR